MIHYLIHIITFAIIYYNYKVYAPTMNIYNKGSDFKTLASFYIWDRDLIYLHKFVSRHSDSKWTNFLVAFFKMYSSCGFFILSLLKKSFVIKTNELIRNVKTQNMN